MLLLLAWLMIFVAGFGLWFTAAAFITVRPVDKVLEQWPVWISFVSPSLAFSAWSILKSPRWNKWKIARRIVIAMVPIIVFIWYFPSPKAYLDWIGALVAIVFTAICVQRLHIREKVSIAGPVRQYPQSGG